MSSKLGMPGSFGRRTLGGACGCFFGWNIWIGKAHRLMRDHYQAQLFRLFAPCIHLTQSDASSTLWMALTGLHYREQKRPNTGPVRNLTSPEPALLCQRSYVRAP